MLKKLTNSSNKKKLIFNPISYTFFILHDLTFKCKRSDALKLSYWIIRQFKFPHLFIESSEINI